MITNKNFNPDKLAEYKELDGESRYEKGHRRALVSKQIQIQRDPSYRVDEEVETEE